MTTLYLIADDEGTAFGLALCALAIGLILAMGFAVLAMAPVDRHRAGHVAARSAENFGVLFIYFVASQLLIRLADGVTLHLGSLLIPLALPIGNVDISPFLCGILTLSLLHGLPVSLSLTAATVLVTLLLALLFTLIRTLRTPVLSPLVTWYIMLFTGMLLVQIFLIYYGPGQFAALRALPWLWSLLS